MKYDGNIYNDDKTPTLQLGDYLEFDYSGTIKKINLTPGEYLFECWGAQGGKGRNGVDGGIGGNGAYTRGKLTIESERAFFIVVGEGLQNSNNSTTCSFNGGGPSSIYSSNIGGSGGGASDIRLTGGTWDDVTSLRSRIIVAAAGGGGGAEGNDGAPGGTIEGLNYGGDSKPGTQTAGGTGGGTAGGFGFGGRGNIGQSSRGGAGGGGSGYYGASGGYTGDNSKSSRGNSGSSFISGYPKCNAIKSATDSTHTDQPNHYSGLIFTDASMISGNQSMPNPRGAGDITGNSGHGFIRISIESPLCTNLYFVKLNENIYYYDNKWININKSENELTISDIVKHGLGNDSEYIKYKYIKQLTEFNENGRVEFIMGSHSKTELQDIALRLLDQTIDLNKGYNFSIIKKE